MVVFIFCIVVVMVVVNYIFSDEQYSVIVNIFNGEQMQISHSCCCCCLDNIFSGEQCREGPGFLQESHGPEVGHSCRLYRIHPQVCRGWQTGGGRSVCCSG